jgi:gliding motility-associated-like protein
MRVIIRMSIARPGRSAPRRIACTARRSKVPSCGMPMLRTMFLAWSVTSLAAAAGQSTLRFVENKGQWPAAVSHRAELPNATVWCEPGAVLIDLWDAATAASLHADILAKPPERIAHHAVRLRFIGASEAHPATGARQLPGHHSYFIGSDASRWASAARAFGQVEYSDAAPGCRAIVYEGRSGLKFDLVLAPGADAEGIRWTYEGADRMLLRNGALVVETSLGRLVERIPIAYQDIDGERRTVACTYTLKGGIVGIKPAAYDKRNPLVIDPTLSFATYSGSHSNNFGYTATFDQAGFLYAGSTAFGQQYPVTTGAYQVAWAGGNTDIAITKYDTTGTFLVWSTFLGGGAAEMPHSMIVGPNDEIYVLGTTGSSNFPITASAYDHSFGSGTAFTPAGLGLSYPNGCDMVVARLSANGSALLGSTYLGGTGNDGLNSAPALKFNYADEVRGEVLLDAQGRVWVVSSTQSIDAPTTAGAAQPAFGGGSHDGYAARLSPDLSQLQFASFLGGTGADALYNGDLDAQGRLYVSGGTTSSNLPSSAGAAQPAYSGGTDAIAARLSASGSAFERLTYWGSAAYDQAYFIELDQAGSAYLFGQTAAPSGQLVQNAVYSIAHGGQFLTKLNHDLSAVLLSSRFGAGDGTPDISPTAFLVDVCDKIYTSGWGSSAGGLGGALTTAGLPVTPDAVQATTDGHDLYLAVFDIDMNALTYATYYGGNLSPEHVDGGTSRFDRRGRVYQSVCAGCQNHSDFPTTPGAWSATNNSGGCNNAVLKMDFDAPLVIASFTAPDTICGNLAVPFTNLSSGAASYLWDFGDAQTSTAPAPTHHYGSPGTYTVTLTAASPTACNGQDLFARVVHVLPAAPALQAPPDTSTCDPIASLTLVASSQGTATAWHWSSAPAFTDMLNASPSDSTATLAPPGSGTYYVMASNAWGCKALDSTVVFAPVSGAYLFAEGGHCAGDTFSICIREVDPPFASAWSPEEGIIAHENAFCISVSPAERTTYAATVTASGCVWTGTLTVDVSTLSGSAVTATASPSMVLPGETVQLLATPSNGVTYAWQPSTGVSDPSIANPTAVVQQTTTFHVTVSDGVCTQTVPVTVKVHELRCEGPDIFVPNTFTPNGDGANDELFVRGRHIARMDFKVFDRWGELVFESADPKAGWDGRYHGKPVDPAVFVYHLRAWCVDGQEYFTKGNVTVVR